MWGRVHGSYGIIVLYEGLYVGLFLKWVIENDVLISTIAYSQIHKPCMDYGHTHLSVVT